MRGVGSALAERLSRLGVTQVQDLLFVLPLRYEDRTHVELIGALVPGTRVVVEGEVQLTEITFRRRRQPTHALATIGSRNKPVQGWVLRGRALRSIDAKIAGYFINFIFH